MKNVFLCFLFYCMNFSYAQIVEEQKLSYEGEGKIVLYGKHKGKYQKLASVYFEYNKGTKKLIFSGYDVPTSLDGSGYATIAFNKVVKDNPEHKSIEIVLTNQIKRDFLNNYIEQSGGSLSEYEKLSTADFDILFYERYKKKLDALSDDQLYERMYQTIKSTDLYHAFAKSPEYKLCEFGLSKDEFAGGIRVEVDFCR